MRVSFADVDDELVGIGIVRRADRRLLFSDIGARVLQFLFKQLRVELLGHKTDLRVVRVNGAARKDRGGGARGKLGKCEMTHRTLHRTERIWMLRLLIRAYD
jgi:hypothetical protein